MAGIFDLLTGDPTQQIAQRLGQAPGQPGSPQLGRNLWQRVAEPLRQAGGPPGPPPGAPPAPPQPQIYQSPPDLAQMYMQLQQHDTASNQFYSGLGLLAAGMYPGRNPNASMKWAQGMQQDPNSMFNNLVQIRGMQQQQASLDAFNRSIPDMMKQTGLTADEIRANPQAATELVGKIAATNAGISSDPTVQEMNRAKGVYMAQNGITDPNDPRIPDKYKYPAQYKAGAAADVAVATDKTDAANSFNSVDPQWKTVQDNLAWLNDKAHHDAVVAAIQHPDFQTSGYIGQNLPSWVGGQPQDVLDAKAKLDTLRAQLQSEAFRNTKNVRSNREAAFLGDAQTNLFKITNSDATITDALTDLQNKVTAGRANATLAAGRPIPAEWAPNADQTLLDPKNQLFNGGSVLPPADKPPVPNAAAAGGSGKPLSADDLTQAKTLIAQHGRDWVIKYLQGQGYKTDGL